MALISLYLSTAVVFLGLDAVMLKTVMKPLFSRFLGDTLLEAPKMAPAALFYLFYCLVLLWFVSWPQYVSGTVGRAFLNGALIGAMAYGTYEFTNLATLKGWNWRMVVTDFCWGALLTGTAAAAGVAVTRALFPLGEG